jgi:hypothetical protein
MLVEFIMSLVAEVLVDTGFVLGRAEVVEGGVEASSVVPAVDPVVQYHQR